MMRVAAVVGSLWRWCMLARCAAPAGRRTSAARSSAPCRTPRAACCPASTVTVTNTETGISQTVVTDAQGRLSGALSQPGTTTVTAELSGFKKVVRPAMQVRSARVAARRHHARDRRRVSETVHGARPRRRCSTRQTGVSGTTVDAKQIAQLPLGDGTAYMLTRLAPGIMDSSDLHFARPMDNGNLGGIVAERRPGRQRVHDRRRAEPLERARRRLLAAVGRDLAVQGADQRVRRADRATPPARPSTSRSRAARTRSTARRSYFNRDASRTETPLLTERGGRHEADAHLQPLHGARSAGRSSRTGRSSWCRTSTCATCSPSRRPTPCRRRRCAPATFGVLDARSTTRAPRRAPARGRRSPNNQIPTEPDQRGGGGLRRAVPAARTGRARSSNYFTNSCGRTTTTRPRPHRSQLHRQPTGSS